ncbi:MAG: hypothetical protein KDA65_01145 [Planctomycetaceae bacterium]|nr:hypothetical protein [Planctomycetaceae bacterium]
MNTDKHGFWEPLLELFRKKIPNLSSRSVSLTMRQYVENYVDERDQALFGYQEEDYRDHGSIRKIIFVATLWSGPSQMALRQLGEYLRNNHVTDLVVFVINSENECHQHLVPEHLYYQLVGYGPILLYHDGNFVGHSTGQDLDHFHNSLDQFMKM